VGWPGGGSEVRELYICPFCEVVAFSPKHECPCTFPPREQLHVIPVLPESTITGLVEAAGRIKELHEQRRGLDADKEDAEEFFAVCSERNELRERLKEVERQVTQANQEIEKWEGATARAEARAKEAQAALTQLSSNPPQQDREDGERQPVSADDVCGILKGYRTPEEDHARVKQERDVERGRLVSLLREVEDHRAGEDPDEAGACDGRLYQAARTILREVPLVVTQQLSTQPEADPEVPRCEEREPCDGEGHVHEDGAVLPCPGCSACRMGRDAGFYIVKALREATETHGDWLSAATLAELTQLPVSEIEAELPKLQAARWVERLCDSSQLWGLTAAAKRDESADCQSTPELLGEELTTLAEWCDSRADNESRTQHRERSAGETTAFRTVARHIREELLHG